MEKILSTICDLMIAHEIIQPEDREVYEYCFAVLFLNFMYYLICFAVMLYYNCYLLPVIFTIVFLLLRSYMGGWHAPSMWGCLLFGLLLFTIAVNLMIYPDITEQGKLLFGSFSIFFAGWSVHQFGIQDHPNRRLHSAEKIAAQKKCYVLLAVIGCIMIFAALLQQSGAVFSVALACFAATILLLLAKFQERGTTKYEEE